MRDEHHDRRRLRELVGYAASNRFTYGYQVNKPPPYREALTPVQI